jgi:hypothetical protein
MSDKEAERVLSWKSTSGEKRCILLVEDSEVPQKDINRKVLEKAKYDSEKGKWTTEETIDHVSELESFGIPQELVS